MLFGQLFDHREANSQLANTVLQGLGDMFHNCGINTQASH
jgi:hypothetical protein